MKYLCSDKLYCFSPLVMITTCVIEVALALWTVWRYRLNAVTRLIVAILMCLAIFQLAEYNVCTAALGLSSLDWARVGFASITLLPPLGIHLAHSLVGDRRRTFVLSAYAAAVLFAAIFLLAERGMQSHVCAGNYVIFHTAPVVWPIYAVYYYGLLAVGVVYAFRSAARVKNSHLARALRWLAIGYMAFIVPTTFVNIIDPSTIAGIPSIMCGFAVILALILGFGVLPSGTKTITKTHR